MANIYPSGSTVRCSVAFTDNTGVAVDPTTVVAKVRDPANAVTTPAPTKDSVGNYHVDLSLSTPGDWWWGFFGTGSNAAAKEQRLHVAPSHFDAV